MFARLTVIVYNMSSYSISDREEIYESVWDQYPIFHDSVLIVGISKLSDPEKFQWLL